MATRSDRRPIFRDNAAERRGFEYAASEACSSLYDAAVRTNEMIAESRDLIAKVDKLLAR
jgi:hypothetical protein